MTRFGGKAAARPAEGVTVQCVGCKGKRTLSFEEAAALTDQPTCETCLLPMVTIEARVRG
jgi:hypothetical protein